jgi:hypothetical protein
MPAEFIRVTKTMLYQVCPPLQQRGKADQTVYVKNTLAGASVFLFASTAKVLVSHLL